MDFETTLKSCLMEYPSIFPNALSVYDHLFCTIGNGYEWENGQLVDGKDKAITIEEAVVKQIQDLIDDPIERFTVFEDFDFGTAKKILNAHYKRIIKYVKMIFDTDNRMKDFSFDVIDEEFISKVFDDKCKLYPLSKYSHICNIPDDVQYDWLMAAKKMYDIIIENEDRVDGEKEWLPKIGERIDTLLKKFEQV